MGNEGGAKMVVPRELQIRMTEFFLKTSIPRIKRRKMEQAKLSSENENSKDGSEEK